MMDKNSEVIYGRNPVLELLKSSQPVDRILVSDNEGKGSIKKIMAVAKEKGIPVKFVSKDKLSSLASGENHQGVAAFAAAYEYSEIEDIFSLADSKGEQPFIIILDKIEDPHNMGAIIRTAEVVGAHGVIIPRRHSVGLTSVVMKVSAGACKHVPVVRVPNLTSVINDLKERGVWIYCLEACGKNYLKFDYKDPLAVVIGSEGEGVSRLVRENSDFIISLPVRGKINSLNASVAAGVFMYEISRQRSL